MIVNLVDSTLFVPRQPGAGTVPVCWHVGSQIPAHLFLEAGVGAIELMRIIAPHRDVRLLIGLLAGALPSLRPHFAAGGFIEIYGKRAINTIGGFLRRDNTIGGFLRRDSMNTIGGALRGDTMNTIGGFLRRDSMNTIGGSVAADRLNTIGGSLAADLSWAILGAECVVVRP